MLANKELNSVQRIYKNVYFLKNKYVSNNKTKALLWNKKRRIYKS